KGAVCASDAFFPFTDAVEALAGEGIVAVIVPGGAKRDEEVQAAAERMEMSLLFTNDRHFRH
ncbi:MAG: bifunctional phosphoribosylaminoimidazolecarboxamide formyltransferase/IMP cyclohydrolase, partial [Bdellovibrionales bacterium]|nr:bifunctional phosphoribosylaminoimidazolecarboxamide formyltransferase/IMP cyclohydrolase [Bdellovibrionales bacterium]